MNVAPHTPQAGPARVPAWAWVLLPLACHFGFSWIGFNPTDDGWLQAVARRLLDGEVPHRDFIFVRPALSAYLQVPLVWLGGDHVIWLSRLWGWLTIGALAWIWSGLFTEPPTRPVWRLALYATMLFLIAHVFPVMAWHSLDGMLFATVAVRLAAQPGGAALRWAFVFAGLAGLCRQNFALFPAFLLLGCARPDKWRALPWVAAGPLAYAALLGATGALGDFLTQVLATKGEFRRVAWEVYRHHPAFLWAVPAGTGAVLLLHRLARRHPPAARFAAAGLVLAAGLFFADALRLGSGLYHARSSMLLGFLLGASALYAWLRRPLPAGERLLLVTVPGLAWVTAISIGYNSPALVAGVMFGLLVWQAGRLVGAPVSDHRAGQVALVAALGAVALAFWHARQAFPYRDQPATELTHETGPVLPGAAGMRTNRFTHAVLADLQHHIRNCEAEGRPYVVLTDGAAAWIRSRQRNLLPVEWPQVTELGNDPALIGQVLDAIRRLPPDTHILVQRCLISELKYGLYAMPEDAGYYAIQLWVGRHCPKVKSTGYYDIHLPPAR